MDSHTLRTRNQALTRASGSVDSGNPLVKFLYVLMRDHLPPGKVEEILRQHVLGTPATEFSNGWLALYAKNLAEELEDF